MRRRPARQFQNSWLRCSLLTWSEPAERAGHRPSGGPVDSTDDRRSGSCGQRCVCIRVPGRRSWVIRAERVPGVDAAAPQELEWPGCWGEWPGPAGCVGAGQRPGGGPAARCIALDSARALPRAMITPRWRTTPRPAPRVRRYNDPVSGNDGANAIAVSPSTGGAFVTGSAMGGPQTARTISRSATAANSHSLRSAPSNADRPVRCGQIGERDAGARIQIRALGLVL